VSKFAQVRATTKERAIRASLSLEPNKDKTTETDVVTSGKKSVGDENASYYEIAEHFSSELEQKQHELSESQSALQSVGNRLRELNQLTGLRRAASVLERKKLEKEREELRSRTLDLNIEIRALRPQVAEHTTQVRNLKEEKVKDMTLKGALDGVRDIRADYEQYLEELLKDGKITKEIQDAFIGEFVMPLVDGKDGITQEQKDDFYNSLQEFLQKRDVLSEEDKQKDRYEFNDSIKKISREIYQDVNVHSALEPLIKSWDRYGIGEMVAKLSATDIAVIKNTIEAKIEDGSITDVDLPYWRRALEDAVYPPSTRMELMKEKTGSMWELRSNFESYIDFELHKEDEPFRAHLWQSVDSRMKYAMGQSELVNALFPGMVRQENEEENLPNT
jgi:hypothetical protein